MNRKQRRKGAKIEKNLSPSERNLSEKIFLFEQIPVACTTCEEPFDKTDKSMALTWKVVVREEQQQVRLFCPTCIKKTQEALEKNG